MVGVVLTIAPRTSDAQGPPVESLRPRTLGGIVTDTLGRPLVDAEVYLLQLKKRLRTREDGRFLFDSVQAGHYDVSARASGYEVTSIEISVSERGGFLQLALTPSATSLPAVVTVADVGGLSGVIGDTAYAALADVEVTVPGASSRARTDSLGRFTMPLKAGSYMVTLKRPGYGRQVLSVTIPEAGGRKIAAWLAPMKGNADARLGSNLFEMNQRLIRAAPSRTKLYAREDLARMSYITELRQLAQLSATENCPGPAPCVVTDDCTVIVDGGPTILPIWALTTADVEFVEAFTTKIPVPKPGKMPSANGAVVGGNTGPKLATSTSMIPEAGPECAYVALIVWLRH